MTSFSSSIRPNHHVGPSHASRARVLGGNFGPYIICDTADNRVLFSAGNAAVRNDTRLVGVFGRNTRTVGTADPLNKYSPKLLTE